ncbi:right-handed parallel beta-helix repeat-containing protein [Luteolibacter sp. Populi]|uniref:right-handed parallel beta-helix repeat-containing protein n=1 Tax=Luteolibacter sp. Populi TaxID=3230487 RepID=UPI0034661626
MAEFAAARERIAELVRTAPNETIALRFQDGLIDFDRALAAMREEIAKNETETKRLEWMDAARGKAEPVVVASEWKPKDEAPAEILTETRKIEDEPATTALLKIEVPALPAETEKTEPRPAPPETQKIEVLAATAPPLRPAPTPKETEGPTIDVRRSSAAPVMVLILLLLAGVGGWYLWNQNAERTHLQVQERLAFLERLGAKMIDARQWPEADAAYQEIERLRPGSKTVLLGRRSIEAGMEEEQRQFVGYWSGEANNAFDLGRLEDAAAAARKVLDKYPGEKQIAELMGKIEQARSMQAREALVSAATAAIQKRRWDEAETKAKEFTSAFPGDAQGNSLLSEIRAGREKDEKDRMRAKELLAAAKVRDLGQFDREALEWLREAVALAPGDPEIDALYQKMASYTRTLQVPGDFKTLAEALESARDRDRIVVAEGTWTGPLIVDKAVTLEGAGKDKTIVEVEAAASTAATFGIHAGGARVSGITFRHRGFDPGANRFSVLLVRGAEVTMSDCRIADSSGHGLAVIDAGHVAATRCVFENNGWDGVAVRGAGSRIEFSKCESTGNFSHGYELLDGGSGAIHDCLGRDNSASGILVDTKAENVVIGRNDLRGNREYGVVVYSAASGRVHDNQCRENLLGGIAVRFAAARVLVENNLLEKNHGPGLALERGLRPESFTTNRTNANAGAKNIATDLDFSSGE